MSLSPPRLLAAMAAHLPRLPVVLLFVFLAVHVPSTHGDTRLPSTYNASMCQSFSCGGVEISYPFYLANATEATDDYGGNYSCGYTDLKISCQVDGPTETPIIRLGGRQDEYTVKSISYNYNYGTILLVDSDVLLQIEDGDCPAVDHEISFDETRLHNTSSNDNLTFYFGCHQRDAGPPDFDGFKIKCAGFKPPPDAGPGDSFVVTRDELDMFRHLEQEFYTSCGKVVSVPVRGDGQMMAASNQSNFTSGGYGDVLKRGFELEWSLFTGATDGCHQCEESEGKCAYSQKREFLGCLCNGGKVTKGDCKSG